MMELFLKQAGLIGAGYVDHLNHKAELEAQVRMISDAQGTAIAFGVLALAFTVAFIAYRLINKGLDTEDCKDREIARLKAERNDYTQKVANMTGKPVLVRD